MSPTVNFFFYALWLIQPVLQIPIAVVMFQRKLHRRFPIFFAYTLSEIIIFAAQFFNRNNSYGDYIYWITEAISLTLGFYIIHELFLDIFQPYHTLKDLGSVLFKWAGLVMLLVAGVVAASGTVTDQPLAQAILTTQRCVRVIQCGLVLFLLLFSHYLGVLWKHKNFGVALGFGFYAAVELFAFALAFTGHLSLFKANFAIMSAYNLSILIWLGYMWSKEKPRDASNLLMSQRWDQSFMDIQHPMPAESLIPMFENMVEQAISRVREDSALANSKSLEPQDMPDESGQTLQEKIAASLASSSDSNVPERASSAAASGGSSSSKS